MTTNWQKVEDRCLKCGEKVGEFKLERRESGKLAGKNMIVVEKKYDNFGSFVHKKGTSIMQAICRRCQSRLIE